MDPRLERDAANALKEIVDQSGGQKTLQPTTEEQVQVLTAYAYRYTLEHAVEQKDGELRYTGGLRKVFADLEPRIAKRDLKTQPVTKDVCNALIEHGLMRRSAPTAQSWVIAPENEAFAHVLDDEEDGPGSSLVLANGNGYQPAHLGETFTVVGLALDVEGDGRTKLQLRSNEGRTVEVYAT